MAMIDRLKKRVETDVDDVELQLMLDEALAEIIARYGPHADPLSPIAITNAGGSRVIDLARPIDTSYPIVVSEIPATEAYWYSGIVPVVLAAGDYQVRNRGRTMIRLTSGTSPRYTWGKTTVTYTPQNDGDQRQEVALKLVILYLQYEGLGSRSVGDVNINHADYQKERAALLRPLAPRNGMLMR